MMVGGGGVKEKIAMNDNKVRKDQKWIYIFIAIESKSIEMSRAKGAPFEKPDLGGGVPSNNYRVFSKGILFFSHIRFTPG